MEKKYELIPNEFKCSSHKGLFRIKALRDFGNVKAGDIGGLVSGEHNLSHDGLCWVYDSGVVSGKAIVREDAIVRDAAMVFGNAAVFGNAIVRDKARVYDNAEVSGDVNVSGNAHICGDTIVDCMAALYFVEGVLDENAKVDPNLNELYEELRKQYEVNPHLIAAGYTSEEALVNK